MKMIAINGSPRKNWNTGTLLHKALEGAEIAGAKTEMIHLYDLAYKGCISCFACKRKDDDHVGRCIIKDDLKPVLDKIDQCDGLILGSPIYFSDITGMMRAFLERLLFQYLSYDDYTKPFLNRTIKTAFIYTMNIPEPALSESGYHHLFQSHDMMLKSIFKHAQYMVSTETLQVNDYSKYHMAQFNETERKKRRAEVFPADCQKAYDLGRTIAGK